MILLLEQFSQIIEFQFSDLMLDSNNVEGVIENCEGRLFMDDDNRDVHQ